MKNLISIVSKFKDVSALVIGDIILDRYIGGKSNNYLGISGSINPIKSGKNRFRRLNDVAMNLSTIGVSTTVCGIVGNDKYGNEIIDRAKK